MAQPEPSASRAVIVGVQGYQHLDPLPAVANNVRRMAELLRDPDLWGLPEENCTVLLDPTSDREVLEAVHEAASQAQDGFLLYFAGHGLPEQPDGLQLALPDTSSEHLFRALSYDRVRSVILRYCTALHKVVILDTCFSGRALKGVMGPDVGVADFAEVDGTFLMTSSAENRTSMAPVGAEFTLFTGELVRVLDQGHPDTGDLLDMDTIYRSVDRALRAGGGPVPQQRARNAGARITFVRNRAHLGERRGPRIPAPRDTVVPAGYEALLDETVPGLIERLAGLTKSGRGAEADAVLTAVATRWPEQEAAALLGELRSAGLGRETKLACEAVAARPAAQVTECLHVLEQIGEGHVADMMFEALARTGPTAVAAAARSLRDLGLTVTERLVRPALAMGGPDGSADLVVALHQQGLGDEAMAGLRMLVAREPDPEYVRVADALLERDSAESAYALYLALPAALAASRSREETARLLLSMKEQGAQPQAEELLRALLAAEPEERVGWALALHTVGLAWGDEAARDLLRRASAEKVLRIMEKIRRTRPDALVTVVRWATSGPRGAADTVAFMTALRRFGRPLDAMRLLTDVADSGPEQAAALIAALRDLGHEAVDRLLERAAGRPAAQRVVLVTAMRAHGARDDADRMLADLLNSADEELLGALPALAAEVDVETLHAHIAGSAGGEDVAPVVRRYLRDERFADVDRLLDLLAERSEPLLEEILAELPVLCSPDECRHLAASMTRLGLRAVVRVTAWAATEPGASDSDGSPLSGVVAEGLIRLPRSVLLPLIAELRRLYPEDGGRAAVWALGEALAGRDDAPRALLELWQSERPVAWLPLDLRTLMEVAPADRVVAVYRVMAESGVPQDESVLAGLGLRADLPAVLTRLRRAGLPRGDAVRVLRSSARRHTEVHDPAVARVLEEGLARPFDAADVDRARRVLWQAARALQPYQLAELLGALYLQEKEADVAWVVTSAVERVPLEDWLPDVLAELGGARLDEVARLLIQAVVRRSKAWEVRGTAAILREDGMDEYADQLDDASRGKRMTRWLRM
ncbi:caspase family protein [Streptomyces arenae]|uniref:caspase family protein n=1 Tax=Streptomyces arenae TaxID=29301 RepID=UPI0026598C69|nr:caspase family protein [Streptomyces arenae]MCG7204040.1 caspase family protein [Streptomyces arenae]